MGSSWLGDMAPVTAVTANMTSQKGVLGCLPELEGPPDLVLVAWHVPAHCPASHCSPLLPGCSPRHGAGGAGMQRGS